MDGIIRYYDELKLAKISGPIQGSRVVTEHNPKTGQVNTWYESYDHAGNVVRVHPKTMDGQVLRSQHYPLTGKEQAMQSRFEFLSLKP